LISFHAADIFEIAGFRRFMFSPLSAPRFAAVFRRISFQFLPICISRFDEPLPILMVSAASRFHFRLRLMLTPKAVFLSILIFEAE
jgi:hypothetical protein